MRYNEFINKGMGRCFVLKENENSFYKLIYAIEENCFIVISGLDKTSGNWGNGEYFFDNLDKALYDYNNKVKVRKEIER